MPKLTYRPASPEDATQLLELLEALGYAATERDLAERLRQIEGQGHRVFVAEKEGEVVGCVQALIDIRLAEGRVGEIVSLVVKPPARGSGIGKGLLQTATEWLQARGCAQIRVRANENRAEAHQFYLAQGFAEIKRQKVFLRKSG